MLYIRVSTFSFCLRPTNSLSDSLPFETGRYTYIHSLSFFNSRSLFLSLSFSPLLRSFFSLLLFFFPSRSFQSSVGEKYIFVHRMKPLSPTPFGSTTRNTLFSSYSLARTFSLSLLFTSDLRSTTEPDFRERALENTCGLE